MNDHLPGAGRDDGAHDASRAASMRLARIAEEPLLRLLMPRMWREVGNAWRAVGRLSVLTVSPSASPEGRVIRSALQRQSQLARVLVRGATHVLRVPAEPADYRSGASRKLLRNQTSRAVRLGVVWRESDDTAERVALLRLADRREAAHPMARYRNERPENAWLLGLDTWLVAEDAAANPLLLAVLAVDGDWATLQYFRTMRDDETASAARYLMMDAVVRLLSERGVRFLASDLSPLRLPKGLREFKERTGYDLWRVKVRR